MRGGKRSNKESLGAESVRGLLDEAHAAAKDKKIAEDHDS
jgi:hypothetical protein